MKNTTSSPRTLVALAAIGFAIMAIAANERFRAPSDMLSRNPPNRGMAFVLYQMSDLREAFSDHQVIKDREAREVCRVDSQLVEKWRAEVPVGSASELEAVLLSIGITNWDGGKQIRLIQKNAIVQSSFPRRLGAPTEPWKSFLKNPVHPGDLIVICTQD